VRTQDSAHTGAGYVATLIDLGRPPVSSLVEPARELAMVRAELSAVRDHQAGTTSELTLAPGRPGGKAPRGPDRGSQE
jgi:hypothetical protein